MPLRAIEDVAARRLAGTLPGGRSAAALRAIAGAARLAPGRGGRRTRARPRRCCCSTRATSGVGVPLTVRASGLARHAGQISLPGGATDPGRDARRHGAAGSGGRDRRRRADRPRARRAHAGARHRQRLHAASGRRRHRRAAGVRAGAGRSRGGPGSVARRSPGRLANPAWNADPRRRRRRIPLLRSARAPGMGGHGHGARRVHPPARKTSAASI